MVSTYFSWPARSLRQRADYSLQVWPRLTAARSAILHWHKLAGRSMPKTVFIWLGTVRPPVALDCGRNATGRAALSGATLGCAAGFGTVVCRLAVPCIAALARSLLVALCPSYGWTAQCCTVWLALCSPDSQAPGWWVGRRRALVLTPALFLIASTV